MIENVAAGAAGSVRETRRIRRTADDEVVLGRNERRALRLVTIPLSVRVEGPGGLRMTGRTTGLSETGIAGRMRRDAGELPPPPIGTPVALRLALPRDPEFPPVMATIVRVEGSWEPGYHYFIAFRFVSMAPEDLAYLRRFIDWREEDYQADRPPVRQWYLFRQHDHHEFGPITAAEVHATASRGDIGPEDLIWSPVKSRWMPFNDADLQETLRGDASPPVPEAVNQTGASSSRVTTRPRAVRFAPGRGLAGLAAALLLVIALAAAAWGWWQGTLDWTEAGELWRSARSHEAAGDNHKALEASARLLSLYPQSHLARRASLQQAVLVTRDLVARDATAAGFRGSSSVAGRREAALPLGEFLVGDFDRDGAGDREWESPFGGWIGNAAVSQHVGTVLDPTTRWGENGGSLEVSWSFSPTRETQGGAWLRLASGSVRAFDASSYRSLVFYVKGSSVPSQCPERMKVELRSPDRMASVTLTGFGPEWKRFEVPLARFAALRDLSRLNEIVFVLDSRSTASQAGVLHIDEVSFVR